MKQMNPTNQTDSPDAYRVLIGNRDASLAGSEALLLILDPHASWIQLAFGPVNDRSSAVGQ
jgi:hypothetical protein